MSSIGWYFISALGLGLAVPVAIFLWRRLSQRHRNWRLKNAKDEFHLRREWLEAEFLSTASKSGKPRGLAWADCDFQDGVSFARDRHNGELCALVGIAISFEAIDGGGMEDNPNVDRMKAGSAVFRHNGRNWRTDGRALLNLDPHEAIARLHNELEMVD